MPAPKSIYCSCFDGVANCNFYGSLQRSQASTHRREAFKPPYRVVLRQRTELLYRRLCTAELSGPNIHVQSIFVLRTVSLYFTEGRQIPTGIGSFSFLTRVGGGIVPRTSSARDPLFQLSESLVLLRHYSFHQVHHSVVVRRRGLLSASTVYA